MGDDGLRRERVVTWEDPLPGAGAARDLAGIDYLSGILRGDYPAPPISRLMGFTLEEVREGRAVFAVEPGEHHYNPIGLVHGGLLATLLDSAMGCAVHSTLPAGTGYTTVEVKVNFVRPVTRDTGRLRCEGALVHAGSRIATAEGRVTDGSGRLFAHATTTCLLIKAKE